MVGLETSGHLGTLGNGSVAGNHDIDASGAYDVKVFDLTPYAGKTVTIRATATNNNDGFASGWFIDDVAVKVTTS